MMETEKGVAVAAAKQKKKSASFARFISPKIREMQTRELSVPDMVKELNQLEIVGAGGRTGNWTTTSVRNVLAKM